MEKKNIDLVLILPLQDTGQTGQCVSCKGNNLKLMCHVCAIIEAAVLGTLVVFFIAFLVIVFFSGQTRIR